MANDEAAAPPEEATMGAFYKSAMAKMDKAATGVIADHPEIRSVVIVFDYAGSLNELNIRCSAWIGAKGIVTDPSAIVGAVNNVLMTALSLVARGGMTAQSMRDELLQVAKELLAKRKELSEINAQLDSAKSGGTGAGSGAGSG